MPASRFGPASQRQVSSDSGLPGAGSPRVKGWKRYNSPSVLGGIFIQCESTGRQRDGWDEQLQFQFAVAFVFGPYTIAMLKNLAQLSPVRPAVLVASRGKSGF